MGLEGLASEEPSFRYYRPTEQRVFGYDTIPVTGKTYLPQSVLTIINTTDGENDHQKTKEKIQGYFVGKSSGENYGTS